MTMIKGITVKLHEQVETGVDAFGVKTYEEVIVEVENVLVAPVSSSSLPDTINPDGKKAVYTLAVPKGDQHDWTSGFPYEGIDDLIPLDWNMKVQVEAYE